MTYQVNSTGDASDANTSDGVCQTSTPGECTLRAAVEQANVTGGTILVPAITITLTHAAMSIEKDMTIVGAGMRKTVVTGNSLFQIFTVGAATAVSASISDMTLRDGIVVDSGGAIFVKAAAKLTVTRCYFTNNLAFQLGGAILCGGAVNNTNLVIQDSVIEKNQTTMTNSSGGGVGIITCNLTMTGTTVQQNTSDIGGGVSLSSGLHYIANSTIGLNIANVRGGGLTVGPSLDGTLLGLYSSTVAENLSKAESGGGISVQMHASITLQNSILAYNQTGPEITAQSDCNGTISSQGHVILSSASGCTVTDGAFSVADPLLGPLQDNGGLARTYALLAGSPAIDAGTDGGCFSGIAFLATDERGAHRVVGARCDIGAYERTPCGDVNGDGSVNVSDVFFLINYLFAGGPLPPGLANVNSDAFLNVSDVFFLINRLFAGGPAPTCPGT